MYAGSIEEFGGPELVFGVQNESQQLNGATVNEYMLKGINYIIQSMPTDQGYQLIKLKFGVSYNQNVNLAGDNCLPGDPCNEFYPCFAYTHYWNHGRFARKSVYER